MLVATLLITCLLIALVVWFMLRKPAPPVREAWLELADESEAQAQLCLLNRFDLPRDAR
ncbi:hypothetical protein KSF73_13105 [Burkholderiaceae bacterium DAT-1]|nr:hypothetical protein [Burkholderiaceae bacterium DAT-1]